MSPQDIHNPKRRPQPKNGLQQALEGVMDRLRKGLEQIAEGLAPGTQSRKPQPVPIPIPVHHPRRK